MHDNVGILGMLMRVASQQKSLRVGGERAEMEEGKLLKRRISWLGEVDELKCLSRGWLRPEMQDNFIRKKLETNKVFALTNCSHRRSGLRYLALIYWETVTSTAQKGVVSAGEPSSQETESEKLCADSCTRVKFCLGLVD